MKRLFMGVDDLLRGRGRFDENAPATGRLKLLVCMVVVFGAFYGAVMGSFNVSTPGHWPLMIYAAAKVPVLLLATFLICLPSFFVINALVGLRTDWLRSLSAVVATQASLTIVLASLAPVVFFFYLSDVTYEAALVLNGIAFAAAAGSAQIVTMRTYRPLIAADPRHRAMLYVWFFLYIFVGTQMAWMLRPFVGDPKVGAAFFREGAWGNAYVVVLKLVGRTLEQFFGL